MIRPIECPICGTPVLAPVGKAPNCFPFCSERCRQVDLLRWSKGKYAIIEPLRPEHLEAENDVNESPDG
jgi:endogenous inhibitor of DNA gyrase (YacG/DUF329 family)